MRLARRVALTGLAVLAVTLAMVAVITYQILRVTGRQEVDQVLRDELDSLSTAFPALLDTDGELTGDELRTAAQQYLAVNPGTSRQLTVLVIRGDAYTTRTGPEPLLDLEADGDLPVGRTGEIRTQDSDEGPVRVLNAPILAGDETIGQAIVAASLRDVRAAAADALAGIAAGGAIGLVLGGAALTVTTRRALDPVVELARAARDAGGGDLAARVPEPARFDEVGELAREFNRMLERIAADADHRRRQLAAVSHELRTPLAVARGHLEMFEVHARASDRAQWELAATIGAELDRLTRIIGDLEAVLHGDPTTSMELGPVFVPDVFDDLGQRLVGLGITDVALHPAPPVVIDADQDRLAQALLNLVTNAVTHTPEGTQVRVDAAVVNQTVRIAVSDGGPGIDPTVRDHLFEPFVTTRADGSTRGRGLGLAIARTLVEAHRGTIAVATSTAGTEFTIELPLPSDEPT